MKQELQEDLFKRGPLLFKLLSPEELHKPGAKWPITWGFECGNGWYELLKETIIELETYLGSLAEGMRDGLHAVQIKEKFGTLRFYLANGDKKTKLIIDAAEARSAMTCELCGKKGKNTKTKGWYKTLCDLHADPNFDLRQAIHESER